MRMVYMSEDDEVRDFAKRAAAVFAKHKSVHTYTNGDIEAGVLLALRMGLASDCVVILRIDDTFEPINYQQLIKQYMEE
jgi:hypothetical protein